MTPPRVIAVAARRGHHFSKTPQPFIRLLANLGVEGDGHMGERVKHRSRARFNPALPNLRQVHLLDTAYIALMAARGHPLQPGDIGENILVTGINLLALPTDCRLTFVRSGARVRLTGLRNPCIQMDRFQPGLLQASLDRDPAGTLIRLSGVMAVVEGGGDVMPGDQMAVAPPAGPPQPLQPV